MKNKTTKFKIKLPDHVETEQELHRVFQEYKLKYSVFADIWEIRNKDFKHSLWYNENKESELKTEKAREYKEVIILNLVSLIVLIAFLLLNRAYNWMEDTMLIFFIWVLLVISFNYLVSKFKPNYKTTFENEHKKVLDLIKSISIND